MTQSRYLNRTNVVLLLVSMISFAFAVSCTAADAATVTGAAAALGAGAKMLAEVVAPLMSPEDYARFVEGVNDIDGTVQQTKAVLGSIVDAFGQFKEGVEARNEIVATTLQGQAVELAGKTTTAEAVGYSGGGGTLGAIASRILSMRKHGTPGRAAPPTA